jgi:phosphoserine aminotransferase
MATATKPNATAAHVAKIADLEQQIADLQARLEQRDELSQVLWLNNEYKVGRTQAGKTKVSFSAQKSVLRGDVRNYGAYKNFVAYGELADAIVPLLQSNERLARVSGFESPWSDNSKRSDWVVTEITIIPRVEPAASEEPTATEQPVPFAQDPAGEEVPF